MKQNRKNLGECDLQSANHDEEIENFFVLSTEFLKKKRSVIKTPFVYLLNFFG